jgi:EAL domain-containing protein (putative c-di-GMP-specific phosphodiesterase class I)
MSTGDRADRAKAVDKRGVVGVSVISQVEDLGPVDLAAESSDDAREFANLLDTRDVHVVFQPLVDLRSGEIVALEALARGPHGSQFASPFALFTAAREADRVAELDWACRTAAYRTFQEANLPPAMSLFINTEPETLAQPCPADLIHFVTRAESALRVFVEVNDRALAADPAGVLAAVARARDFGWGIAIDDVGGNRAPVAMLPIVRPDVVKLDLRLLNKAADEDASAIITSVLRHVETSGAVLLVEGIETKDDARWARALGATYGQGMHLGAPGPLLDKYTAPGTPVRLMKRPTDAEHITSPFALFVDRPKQRMNRQLLERVAAVVASGPRSADNRPVILAGVGRDTDHGAAVVEYSKTLPLESLLFVTFGTEMTGQPAPGVRGVRVRQDDPLADERFLIVLSDQGPMAVFARTLADGRFDVVVTQDPDLVHRVVHHLVRRVPAPGRNNTALAAPGPAPITEHDDAPDSPPKRGWRQQLGLHS